MLCTRSLVIVDRTDSGARLAPIRVVAQRLSGRWQPSLHACGTHHRAATVRKVIESGDPVPSLRAVEGTPTTSAAYRICLERRMRLRPNDSWAFGPTRSHRGRSRTPPRIGRDRLGP
jgi:hypothetical protein